MHTGDNQGKDRQDNIPEEIKENSADRIIENIQGLRRTVDVLRKDIVPTDESDVEITTSADDLSDNDKVTKAIRDEELSNDASSPRNRAPADSSDFAAKYREQMKQQMAEASETKDRRAERAIHREAARKEKERQRALRTQRREEQRRKKIEEDEARRKERRARAKELQKKREIRAEVRRRKKFADKSAEIGGGVVNLHDTEISTEVQPVARFSLRDLLGLAPREKIKAAETEEEIQNIQQEQEAITADARQAATHLRRVRMSRFRNTALGRMTYGIRHFSEAHKTPLLLVLSLIIVISVATAGFYNYYTLYEYSYNGHSLGYVKNKDDVLKITDLVQKALTTDKDIQVVIDASDDISFRRVSSINKEIVPDSSDDVLKRLTYMGDLNVKAWGIYVNGKKVGAVQKKATAADVLKELENRYASGKEGSVIEKAEVQENIEVHKSNTDLRDVLSTEEMTEKLCTDTNKETIHTVVAGETIRDIAATYQTTEAELIKDNSTIDPKKLAAGDTVLIKQTAPPVTVRLTEKRTYDQTIKYETEEKKTDEMYEGEEEIQQEGRNGKEEITEKSVSINGITKAEDIKVLDRQIKKQAVKKIILIGTAERPPSVGDGVYIWPLSGGYRLSSGFGRRWGRLHAGIDMATPSGNDVMAADGGIIVRAGYFGGYGKCVDIDHQNGQSTRYGHLSSILVNVGDEVYEGQHIAESGNTGFSTGAHLHFEIHVGGSPQNPMNYLP